MVLAEVPYTDVDSSPSAPVEPWPKHLTELSLSRTHVCAPPVATWRAVSPVPRFTVGKPLPMCAAEVPQSVETPNPHWPLLQAPQHVNVESSRMAQTWLPSELAVRDVIERPVGRATMGSASPMSVG